MTAIGGAVATAAITSSGGTQCESCKGEEFDTVILRDGRTLAYRIHGKGVPVFALHGMESSRHTWDTSMWGTPQPLEQLFPGVQVIAVDRPGYGDSTSPPEGYSYTDFTDDLAELAGQLKIWQFCVAGHSSGGPYALAAAALMPDRVVACAAVSSDAPYVHPKADAEFVASGEMPADALMRCGFYGGKRSDQHPWKQGPLGYVCDYVLERIEWSFACESIALGPRLTIWYGSKDIDAIIRGGKFLNELIPGAQVRVQERKHGLKKDLDGKCNFGFLDEIFTELKTQWDDYYKAA